MKACEQGRRFCIVSFSYPMLRDVVLHTIKEELYNFGLENNKHFTINKSDKTIIFRHNGAEIMLRSGDKPDSLRGLNISDFGIDEAREFKTREIFDVMLGRIRAVEDAQWYIATTTRGKDWVYDLSLSDNVTLIKQTTFDNPFLPESFLEELQEQYTTEYARQELYAEIVEMGAGIIKPGWFNIIEHKKPTEGVRFWDLAVSIKTAADYSAGALCSLNSGRMCIHDIQHVKIEYPELRKRIIQCAKLDGKSIIIGLEEAGQQRGFIDDLSRLPELSGCVVRAVKPHGDKFNRLMPWASRAELGAVDVCKGAWNGGFFDECNAFTADDSHQHDDQIDAVSGAYNVLTTNRQVTGARVRF